MGVAPVRAVVFDLGNTLWFQAQTPDYDRVYGLQARAVTPLLDRWGIRLREPLPKVLAQIWQASEDADRRERARGSFKEWPLPFLIVGALAKHGIAITPVQAEAWHRAAWISEAEFGLQLYPDVLDVLRELRDMGVAIGVNSNRPCTGDMALPGLHDLGIAPYVDAVVCSGDTGFVKPHPSTFGVVLDRLGVAAAEAVMVGDSAVADMGGARAAGMRSVWKLNGRYDPPPCADADFAIHDLAELLSLPIIPDGPRPLVTAESLTPHEDGNEDRY
jgi:HAD superfamily hydrolase (TIGR01509 family)